jgi:acetyltransferase-like isoleucine patch superfamily enzyme
MSFLSNLDRTGPLYRRVRGARAAVTRARYRVRQVHPTAFLAPGSWVANDLQAAEHVFVGPGCSIESGVSIGRWTMLAAEVAIVGADHRIDQIGTPMQFAGREPLPPTLIGDDCWLGHGVKVMVGVTVGDFAIVAAGSVVTRDVPEGAIVAGVPAKFVRNRFVNSAELEQHRKGLERWQFDGRYSPSRSAGDVERTS